MKMKQNKIGSYLTVAAGIGCVGSASGATLVTFFDPGDAVPSGINFGIIGSNWFVDVFSSTNSVFAMDVDTITLFTDGSDLSPLFGTLDGSYSGYFGFIQGASPGDQNFANISFDGADGVYEAVGQFDFDGSGGGRLVALAQNSDNTALSISDGFSAIQAASVPEPSGIALLALGAAGLLTRRQRKQAA